MSTKPSEPIKPKPCPFCESKKIDISHGMTGAPFLFFKCRECGAVVSFDNDLTNRFPGIAMANWNKRAQHNISDADMKAAADKSCKTCKHRKLSAWEKPCNRCYFGSGVLKDYYEPYTEEES